MILKALLEANDTDMCVLKKNLKIPKKFYAQAWDMLAGGMKAMNPGAGKSRGRHCS